MSGYLLSSQHDSSLSGFFFQNKDSLQSKYTVKNLAEQNKPRCFLFVVVVVVMLLLRAMCVNSTLFVKS